MLQASAVVGLGGLLSRGPVGAAEFVTEACQDRGTRCKRNRQCQCNDEKNVICDPLPRGCLKKDRCCGTSQASCKNDCDCCKGYNCNKNKGVCVT